MRDYRFLIPMFEFLATPFGRRATVGQVRILLMFTALSPARSFVTVTQAANTVGITKSAAHNAIMTLLEAGLVAAAPSNPGEHMDLRERYYTLTDRGQALIVFAFEGTR